MAAQQLATRTARAPPEPEFVLRGHSHAVTALRFLDDVDLGQRTGLQFQQYGDTLEIAVRANVQASNSRLVTYQIDVFFDTAAFEFVSDSCKAGEPGDFDCAGGAYDGDGRVQATNAPLSVAS